MSTDVTPKPHTKYSDQALRLDELRSDAALFSLIAGYEEKKVALVFLEARLEDWEILKKALMGMRASNVSAMLMIQKSEQVPTLSEIEVVFESLREWDQLFLQNVLVLGEPWIPERYRPALAQEAKIELKWFREWFAASTDSRVASYPGLPWRSFIRKTIHENFLFAWKMIHSTSTETNQAELDEIVRPFLVGKKKAINTFPKRWVKFQ